MPTAFTPGDARSVITRRYRAAPEEVSLARSPDLSADLLRDAATARGVAASLRFSVDDVIEAASRVEPEVVEALILERGERFALDRESLLRLSDASVSPHIIDLMVALSFPERFAVEREPAGRPGGGYGYPGVYDPIWSSAYAFPYYFAPFGYYYWYAPWDPVYVVRPITAPGSSVGRVVQGRGYTRVSRLEPDESEDRGARRRRGSGGDGGSGSSDKGSSGGSVSSQGYSRGGSEGRTAKPRK